MKKLILIAVVSTAAGMSSFAGPTGKEILQQAPPPCEWYRAHEWDLDLWGTWAFSANTGTDEVDRDEPGHEPIGFVPVTFRKNLGSRSNDVFLNRDDTWGGGADLKYFFSKYWALGVEGLILDAQRNTAGGGFGTFTFRYPIGCSRFAPYAWAGGGVVAGGGSDEKVFFLVPGRRGGVPVDREFVKSGGANNTHAEAAFQAGTGLEVRITPRIGLMGDFAWNVVSGPDNNFGMTRFGLTLSY
jgi:hypothetical protein